MDLEKAQNHLPVNIVSSTIPSLRRGEITVHKLLKRTAKSHSPSCTIVKNQLNNCHILVVSPVYSSATATITHAVEALSEHLASPSETCQQLTFQYNSETNSHPENFITVVAPLHQDQIGLNLPASLSTPFRDETPRISEQSSDFHFSDESGSNIPWSMNWSVLKKKTKGWSVALCIILGIIVFTALFGAYGRHPTDNTLIQYDVGDSIGPKYTSLLTPENITEWLEQHYNPQDWYIRIDDQVLVPIELMDEQEWRYQEYLSKRYPEKAEMRDSGAWRDPEFLADPNNFMLPSDMEFHTGHCIRAIRRYWQAKETGRHVCPWDIDYLHLRHCFSMLESVMLPPGPRDDSQIVGMSWRTKVCMWEP